MFCKRLKITPEDNNLLNAKHKKIRLRNNRLYHVLHINESPTKSENKATLDNSTEKAINHVQTEQPKPIVETNEAFSNSSISKDPISNELTSDLNSCVTKETVCSDDSIRTNFTDLLESSKFKPKVIKEFNLNVKDGSEISIIYKNKIEFDLAVQNKNENNLESQTSNQVKSLPLLFFIHGVGGCLKIWQKQFEYFSMKGYEIVAIDLIGHGASNNPPEAYHYQFLEMALDVLLIFEMFIKNDNILIGHSYGCSFATYVAQSRKSVVSKLILISGGSPHPLDYNSSLLKAPICCIKTIKPLINCHFFCSAFSSCFRKPENGKDAFNISTEVLFYTMKGQIWRAANESYHKTIEQSVLLIEGQNDNFIPLSDAIDMIKILKYGYLVVIKKGSHMVLMENHETVNDLIFRFLNDNFQKQNSSIS